MCFQDLVEGKAVSFTQLVICITVNELQPFLHCVGEQAMTWLLEPGNSPVSSSNAPRSNSCDPFKPQASSYRSLLIILTPVV